MDESKRCTATSKRTGQRCQRACVPGAPTCRLHGSAAPQVRAAAERRVQEAQALELAKRTMPSVDLTQFGDPMAALEHTVAYSHHLAIRLAAIVERIPDDQLAYRGRLGEQLRGEVTAAQRAWADLRQAAADSIKLGLAERRARIEDDQVALVTRALDAALQATGLGLEGQERARAALRRTLKAAANG
jgi:hypothetical protein